MKPQLMIAAALLTLGIVACNESTTEPTPQPTGETMQFKPGARYEYTTYSTDTATQAPIESTRRTKTRTLIASNASVNGKAGVAVSLDSLFATAGGFLSVTDSVLLQQTSGTNEIYRYASLAPELDFSGIAGLSLDIGSAWRHEATLGATSAKWFLGEVADTFQIDGLPPQVKGVKAATTRAAAITAQRSASNVFMVLFLAAWQHVARPMGLPGIAPSTASRIEAADATARLTPTHTGKIPRSLSIAGQRFT